MTDYAWKTEGYPMIHGEPKNGMIVVMRNGYPTWEFPVCEYCKADVRFGSGCDNCSQTGAKLESKERVTILDVSLLTAENKHLKTNSESLMNLVHTQDKQLDDLRTALRMSEQDAALWKSNWVTLRRKLESLLKEEGGG